MAATAEVNGNDLAVASRALVCDDTKTSYSALGNDVARFADYLTYGGLQPGDRVGVMLPNGPEFAVVFYGVTPRAVRSMTIGTSGMA